MMRYTVHFSGRVQGVGFRYTARNIAQGYNVCGYVENLPDGRVLLVAEGDEGELRGFLDELLQHMSHNVREHFLDRAPGTGEFGAAVAGAMTIRH